MYHQTNLLDAIAAEQAAQEGIQQAVSHANAVHRKWIENVYKIFLHDFLPQHKRFMCEDFRAFYEVRDDYQPPPSNRSFAGVVVRAKRDFYIINIGTDKVSNKKAHRCFASIYERNDERLIENGIIKNG